MQAASRQGVSSLFVWLASDGWGQQGAPVKGNNRLVAEGALTIELQSSYMPEFDTYFQALRPDHNHRNPWFREFWETTHGCRFNSPSAQTAEDDGTSSAGSTQPIKSGSQNSALLFDTNAQHTEETANTEEVPLCTGEESWSRQNYKQESKVLFVYNAVYAMAYGLHAMLEDECPIIEERAGCVKNFTFDGNTFYSKYILNVSFTGNESSYHRLIA